MEPRIVDIDAYMPVLRELLAQGQSVSLTVTGESMSPFLRHGRDQIRLAAVTAPPQRGDMVFFRRRNGQYIMHRVLRRMPDGSLQPLGLPVWRWDTFYIEIVRSIFDGAWDSDAAGARAVNYWWGMRSGAEEIDYSKDLPAGTLQLLDLMEKMLHEDDLRIFPEDLFAQGHVLHSPEATLYSPKELMEMDWLDECVEGGLPHYDELDVKTHTLMSINGLNTLKGFVK